MSDFLILFAKVLGVFLWVVASAGLFIVGCNQDTAKRGIPLIVSGALLLLLGFTFEIYGLTHWWLKP